MTTPPSKYVRTYNFNTFQSNNPTTPLPGLQVDGELNAIKTATDAIIDRLAQVQRADGALANNVVTVDSLSADALALAAGYARKGAWVTATVYALDDVVTVGSTSYVAIVAHTSGTFADDLDAGDWALLSMPGLAVDGTSTVTANIPFGGFKITGLADGVADTDAATVVQAGTIADASAVAAIAAIPVAAETNAGLAEVATDAEMTTGTSDTVFATAKKVATYATTAISAAISVALAAAKSVTGLWTFTNSANLVQTLTDAATIAWDVSAGNVAKVTLAASRTFGAPTNGQTGGFYFLIVKQDATGSRVITWNAIFDFGTFGAPTLTTTAGKSDTLSFFYNGTSYCYIGSAKGFSS